MKNARSKMISEKIESNKIPFYFPQHDVTIHAENIEEATEKLLKLFKS